METASLRIKFTPLLQKSHKNSKCCLEIVPEVSCLQNLDKLEWRQETNFIEYTIPMTYKVILKKRQTINDASDDIDAVKTYHSCVDLLISPSKSTLYNFESGDVSKIISDTFILCKTVTHSTSTDNSMDLLTGDGKICEAVHIYPAKHKTTNTFLQVTDGELKKSKEDIENDLGFHNYPAEYKTTNIFEQETNVKQKKSEDIENNIVNPKRDLTIIESEELNKELLDKLTNTDIDYPIPDDNIRCGNRVLVISEKVSCKAEPKRRLSLSPICSVSTHESPLENKKASKTATCKIYDAQKDLVPLGSIYSTPSDLSNENQRPELSAMVNLTEGRLPKRLKPKSRVPPEIRIAKYIQYMETEVLPLKMIVNDIFHKCSSLGINFSKKSSSQSVVCKTISTYSCPIVTKHEEPTMSNRVVYSIVFDVFDSMNNQQVVVEKIVQNLAFEVEAVPKDKSIKAASVSQNTPLNIKIKVRKKDETQQHIISGIDEPRAVQKVCLVNSDQTIMTFDVFMETEHKKKPQSRKHFYNILKPGTCLGSDDDDYAYMPSSSYSANITEPSEMTKTDGILKQTFTLSRSANRNHNASQPTVHKWFFGQCKPGGCLDPPFSEDKYQYKPRHSSDPSLGDSAKSVQTVPIETIPKDGVQYNKETNDGKSTGRHSSIIDSGLLKKRKKCCDKSTNTEFDINAKETNSIISLFQSDSKSSSTHSNPIITYPSNKTSHDKSARGRGSNEDKSRRSFNENHSEPYFIPPRKNSCITEKEILDSKPRPFDVLRTKEVKEPSGLPLPVPMPISMPLKSEKNDSEDRTINNSLIGDASIGKVKPLIISESLDKSGTPNELVIKKLASIDIPNWNGIPDQSHRNEPKPGDSNNINLIQISTADESNKIEPESEDNDSKNSAQISKISTSDQSFRIEPEPEDIDCKNSTQITTMTKPDQSLKIEQKAEDNVSIIPKQISETLTSDQSFRIEQESEDIRNKIPTNKMSIESDKIESLKPILSDNISMGDVNNDKIRESPDNTIEDQINENDQSNNADTLKKILPIPVPIPLNLGEPTKVTTGKMEKSGQYKPSKGSKNHILDNEPEKPLKETDPSDTESMTIVIDSKKMLRTMSDPFDKESDYSDKKESIIDAPILPVDMGPHANESITTDINIKFEYHNDENMELMDSADHVAEKESDLQMLTTSEANEINPYKDYRELPNAQYFPSDKTTIIGENNQHNKRLINDKDEIKQNLPDEVVNYLDDKSNKILFEPSTDNNSEEMEKYIDKDDKNDHDKTIEYFDNEMNYENSIKLSLDPPMPFNSNNNEKFNYLRTEIDHDNINRKDKILPELEASDKSTNQQQNDIVGKTTKESNNFVTVPVLIDNVDHSLLPLKAVYSETNSIIEPNLNNAGDIIDTKKNESSIADVEDTTKSLISNEHLGVSAVVYDLHNIIPSVKYSNTSPSSDKQVSLHPESIKGHADIISKPLRTLPTKNELKNKLLNRNDTRSTSVISSIQSTSTLKSAMKKDTIYVEFGFQSYLNDKNERVFRTFDAASEPTRIPNDTVTLIKSQVRLSSNEIRIPVDSDHDVSIQLKKPYSSQRVSISESGLVNTIDNDLKPNTVAQTNSGDLKNSEVKGYHSLMQSNIMDGSVMDLYEQQLVPLHLIIKNLRDEIDVLAAQQMLFRDKLYCPRKGKPPRLVHSGKRCVGCLKK